jgi:hypothetical protein
MTLTREQFHKVRPQGQYHKYLSYLARHRNPYSPRMQERNAQRDTRQQFVGPARQESAALIGRASRDVGQLNSRYGSIERALQPYTASGAAAWNQGAQAEQGVGNALAAGLMSQGQTLGANIGSKLADIQAPGQAVSQFAGGTVATGAGAGQAMGALSSADLARLHSYGSAEEVYAAAFPRLAALTADQERRGLMSQYAQELADKQAEAAAGEQQALLENRRYYAEQAQQAASTRYAHQQDTYARKQQAKRDRLAAIAAAQEYGLNVGKFQQSQARVNQGAARVNQGQARLDQAAIRENHRHAEAMSRAQTQAARDAEHRRHDRVLENQARRRIKIAGTKKGSTSRWGNK